MTAAVVPDAPCRGYTIGITMFVNADGDFGFHENGLRQNVVFLFQMFRASSSCRRVVLLNQGDGQPGSIPPGLGIAQDDIVQASDMVGRLDFILVIGAALDRDIVAAFKAHGTRLIAYKGGNAAIIAMEAVIASPPRGDAERYFDVDYYDAIWMTPQHVRTYASWCRTLYRCAIAEVPHIWSPLFVDARVRQTGAAFGYRPGRRPWRIGVMEPNITVMKTSHVPMLVSEAAYRQAPEALRAVYVTNGWPHRDDRHFSGFTMALRAAQAGVMTLEPRFVSADFLANHCDAVVTHQWENGLNYLYYEVLYGGYPLIHNSPFLRGVGYHYEDFEVEAGGAALLRAHREHDAGLAAYRAAVAALLARCDPTDAAVLRRHERLLGALMAG